jgi:hypothetical protein
MQKNDSMNSKIIKPSYFLIFISVILVGIMLRLHYSIGYYYEDAPGYVSDAVEFSAGNWKPRDFVNGLNIGTYLPVGLFIKLFGKNETTLMLWPLLCSILGISSVMGIALLLLGIPYAIIGGLIYAFFPGDIIFSTVVMPDSIQTGIFSLSLFVSVLAETVFKKKRAAFYFLSGAIFGFSYLTRANAVILLPTLICSSVLFKENRTTIRSVAVASMGVFAGFIIIISSEGLLHISYGKPFFQRFIAVTDHYGGAFAIKKWGLNTDLSYMPKVLLPFILWISNKQPVFFLNLEQSLHGIFYIYLLLFFPVLLISLLKNINTHMIAVSIAWFLLPVLYHEFGSQSLSHYVLIHRLSRHFILFLPSAIFLFCLSIKQILEITAFPTHLTAVSIPAIFIILINILVVGCLSAKTYANHVYSIKNIDYRIVEALAGYEGVVVADTGNLGAVIFFLNSIHETPVTPVDIQTISSCKELDNTIVIINSTQGWWDDNDSIMKLKKRLPCLNSPPAKWLRIETNGPEQIYRIPIG